MRTEPDTFAVLDDLTRPVRFLFDERISEQPGGVTLEEAVTVSPRTGEVRVRHSSRSLSVEMEGGFQPGLVYRVTLHPVVSDLFNNQLRDPFELVFTTGGTPTATTLAGQVWDRVTGRGVGGALVTAQGQDSLVHVARADDQGIFALRYMADGTFRVIGFDDLDRNAEVGAREVQGSVSATIGAGDTLLVDVPILAPDTTSAVLREASALDSVTVVAEFDDHLDPETSASGIAFDLGREGEAVPGVTRVLHEHEYAAYLLEVVDSLAVLDSIEAAAAAALAIQLDSAAGLADSALVGPDSVLAPDSMPAPDPAPDTVSVIPGPLQGDAQPGGGRGGAPLRPERRAPPPLPPGTGPGAAVRAAAEAAGRLLPGQRLVALLDAPLEAGAEYQVRVSSVVNINGLPEGGGEATLVLEVPVPEVADSASAVADSVSRADTAAVADSVPAAAPTGDAR